MNEKPGLSQVLWEGPTREPAVQEIRMPRCKFPPRASGAPRQNPPQDNTSTGTVLNVDAPEFVPTWMKEPTPATSIEQQFQSFHISEIKPAPLKPSSVQGRIERAKNAGSNTNQPIEQTPSYYNSTPSEAVTNGYYNNINESPDINRLKQLISSLIKYPGSFDDLLMVFMETIYPYFSDFIVMSQITQLLVGEAISCPNFRYNGVRLCWYVEQKCPIFRSELHLRCQKELQENQNQQNVNLFIAELYTQLPHDSLYGTLLLDSLKRLLALGGNDNIKCVCQALKLTGYSLEKNHKVDLDELISQLREFSKSLSGSALVVLNSVVNLRESNWGRSTVESSHSDSSDYEQDCEEMVNGILYEVEGDLLTNEEQEFLVAHATHDEYVIDNGDPDALFNPEPEMDEEIQAAFEEFVKLNRG